MLADFWPQSPSHCEILDRWDPDRKLLVFSILEPIRFTSGIIADDSRALSVRRIVVRSIPFSVGNRNESRNETVQK